MAVYEPTPTVGGPLMIYADAVVRFSILDARRISTNWLCRTPVANAAKKSMAMLFNNARRR